MATWTLCSDSVRMTIHLLTFDINGCILRTIGSTFTKLKDFVNLGLHFMTVYQ